MAELTKFSDAMSSRPRDWRSVSWRMASAIAGSTDSSARCIRASGVISGASGASGAVRHARQLSVYGTQNLKRGLSPFSEVRRGCENSDLSGDGGRVLVGDGGCAGGESDQPVHPRRVERREGQPPAVRGGDARSEIRLQAGRDGADL